MPSTAGFVAASVAGGVVAAAAVAAIVTWFDTTHDATKPASGHAALPVQQSGLHDGVDALTLEQGRVYYVQLCMDCHGARGDGRGAWAYRVTPRPSNLTTARTQRRSDADLFKIISEPRPGTPMIGWSRQLSESQRRQLVSYLRHLAEGRGSRHRRAAPRWRAPPRGGGVADAKGAA